DRKQYWPISERSIHYKLVQLPVPPLRNSSLPETYFNKRAKRTVSNRYENSRRSSQDLSDLVVRARLTGEIPFEAIGDETRPRTNIRAYNNVRQFIRDESNGFLKNFWRDYQASQPN